MLLIRDLIHLGENHTVAVFVNGSPFYTLPGTLSSLDTLINLPRPLTVIHRQVSEELDTIVLLTEETVRPAWIGVPLLDRQDYGLFVIYLD